MPAVAKKSATSPPHQREEAHKSGPDTGTPSCNPPIALNERLAILPGSLESDSAHGRGDGLKRGCVDAAPWNVVAKRHKRAAHMCLEQGVHCRCGEPAEKQRRKKGPSLAA